MAPPARLQYRAPVKLVALPAFVREPQGRATCGTSFACFCPAPGMGAIVLWGRHAPPDVDQLFAAVDALAGTRIQSLLLDTRGLYAGAPDAAAFDRATHFLPQAWRKAAPTLRRAALVLGRGLQGTLIAGTLHLLDRRVPLQPFRDPLTALRWLDAPGAEDLLQQMDALREAPRVVSALRTLLDETRGALRLPHAARRLTQSVRSLQRHLGSAGTSFRAEVEAARLRAAEELLSSTDLKIAAIAAEVGCASPQHFSALFRRARGMSPQQFRASLSAAC
jgi:AraC-like DNA-binding protein